MTSRIDAPGLFLLLILFGACLSPIRSARELDSEAAAFAAERRFLADAVVANWWPASAVAARALLERYGVPDEVRPERLVWHARGPWKRVIVRNVTPPYGTPVEVPVLSQTVDLSLNDRQRRAVAAFDRDLEFNPDTNELSSVAGVEAHNYLRLNLAHDVANRRMTAAQARAFDARIRALEDAGKTSPYLLGLRFDAVTGR